MSSSKRSRGGSKRWDASIGRPSTPRDHLLRALLLLIPYSVPSERLLMEQIEYNLLFRWFVGLAADDAVWTPTVPESRGDCADT
jgi:transposase